MDVIKMLNLLNARGTLMAALEALAPEHNPVDGHAFEAAKDHPTRCEVCAWTPVDDKTVADCGEHTVRQHLEDYVENRQGVQDALKELQSIDSDALGGLLQALGSGSGSVRIARVVIRPPQKKWWRRIFG